MTLTINPLFTLTPEAIRKILKHSWKMPWIDFYFYHYHGLDLIIAGSHDFSYYHNIEIIAHHPINIQGNTEWSTGIELPFLTFIQSLKDESGNDIQTLQFISDEGIELTITAKSFSYNLDTVFYYRRENLQPHERLAHWLQEESSSIKPDELMLEYKI